MNKIILASNQKRNGNATAMPRQAEGIAMAIKRQTPKRRLKNG
ncbi:MULTISPECIES: hypothetical protein [unclassified Coleofasciculus]|nr:MULTISPECIES: hypothetical protein [unclassified Coleofasciculus]